MSILRHSRYILQQTHDWLLSLTECVGQMIKFYAAVTAPVPRAIPTSESEGLQKQKFTLESTSASTVLYQHQH